MWTEQLFPSYFCFFFLCSTLPSVNVSADCRKVNWRKNKYDFPIMINLNLKLMLNSSHNQHHPLMMMMICTHWDSVNVRSYWINHWTDEELHHLMRQLFTCNYLFILQCILSHQLYDTQMNHWYFCSWFLCWNFIAFVFECDVPHLFSAIYNDPISSKFIRKIKDFDFENLVFWGFK